MSDPLQDLAYFNSLQGGQTAAIVAIVTATCGSIPKGSPLANQIALHLEQGMATNLQVSMNDPYFEGYQKVMDAALACLSGE